MVRQLLDDVHWLHECYEVADDAGDPVHEHVSVYAIEADDGWIVVDTGSFHDRSAITQALDETVGDDPLDAIILSHSDYPHAANVSTLREAWADVELVASSGSPEIQGLPEATRCRIGESMAVAGRPFEFVDPPLADRSHTTWIYDEASGTLFTADGFGSWHAPGECEDASSDFDGGIPAERIREYHRETLVWLRYVDPPTLASALHAILDDREVNLVAPVHGTPILGDDLDDYLGDLVEAAGRIGDGYEVPEA